MVVLVGSEKQRFDIHKGLICSRSEFFKAAFTGNFKEVDGTIKLPEQDPAIFKYFVYWLYTGCLRGLYYPKSLSPRIADLKDLMREELRVQGIGSLDQLPADNPRRVLWERAQYHDLPFHYLIALYILADTLLVQGLQDAVITALIDVYGHNVPGKVGSKLYWKFIQPDHLNTPTRSINSAWETLPKGSNLCQLLVQLFCDSTVDIERYCVEEPLHPDFLVAVGAEFAERWLKNHQPSTRWTTTKAICSYHEHEGASCGPTEKYLEDRKAMGLGN